MTTKLFVLRAAASATMLCATTFASATLNPSAIYSGNVGLSVDGTGGNGSLPNVRAEVPVGATILKAYLYSAGTPWPRYPNSPTTLADYNNAGITLAGNAVNSFDALVGGVSTRADIGRWYTARADVTDLVQSLTTGATSSSFSWAVSEGSRSNRIDGEVLAIVYSLAGLPTASVALLDGGLNTGGETSTVSFTSGIGDPSAPGFAAQFGIASSFSCCNQATRIDVNGTTLTRYAGNFDDGAAEQDGSLITVGGLGDNPGNNVLNYADDDELYDLRPFLSTGDTSFSIFTQNPTNDDNVFFAHLYVTADVSSVVTTPVPEPSTYAMMLLGLVAVGSAVRRAKSGL